MKNILKKAVWFVVFIALVVLTMNVIVKQNASFSIEKFIDFIGQGSWPWFVLAFISMLGFIVFEALAIRIICKTFGYKPKFGQSLVYSSTDLYFSAVTPSATGGQPASAYFMLKDKIPGAVTTIVLLINLTLYTISIIVIGGICLITRPDIFANLGAVSQIMFVVGFVVQFVLIGLFLMLVYKEKIVMKVADVIMRFLNKLHLMKNIDKKREKLKRTEQQYKDCAAAILQHKRRLAVAFLMNLLQRLSQIFVSVFVFIGIGGATDKIYQVFATQGYVVMGSNSLPIPGAVGAADYLFFDGFSQIIKDESVLTNLELLSRGISFYCLVIICGIATLGIYAYHGLKGMKKQ